jgi:hypothetical protein
VCTLMPVCRHAQAMCEDANAKNITREKLILQDLLMFSENDFDDLAKLLKYDPKTRAGLRQRYKSLLKADRQHFRDEPAVGFANLSGARATFSPWVGWQWVSAGRAESAYILHWLGLQRTRSRRSESSSTTSPSAMPGPLTSINQGCSMGCRQHSYSRNLGSTQAHQTHQTTTHSLTTCRRRPSTWCDPATISYSLGAD